MHKNQTYQPTSIIKSYYIYDRQLNTFEKFHNLNDLLTFLAKITKYYRFKKDWLNLDNLLSEQNLTGKDYSVFHFDRFYYTEDVRIFYKHVIIKNLKRFTFYAEYLDHKLHIINIHNYIEDILNLQEQLHSFSDNNNNWCKYYHSKPYQSISHHRKSNKYLLDEHDEYCEEYFKSASKRKKGGDSKKYSGWKEYYTNSQRSWKKQTKNRRQYGNRTRNKELEQTLAYQFITQYDI